MTKTVSIIDHLKYSKASFPKTVSLMIKRNQESPKNDIEDSGGFWPQYQTCKTTIKKEKTSLNEVGHCG